MRKPKIIIAEDHKLFRDGLRLLITSTLGMDVVGEAGDGIETLKLVRQKLPDLLLVDLSMPNMGGIEAIRQVRQISPKTKILVVSMHSSETYLKAAFKAGAHGYLLKIADQNEFQVAVRAILEGKFYISSEFTSTVIEAYYSGNDSEKSSFDTLTNREREVLKLVAEGQTNKQVASLLCIAPKTVDNHRTNIMRKLDLHSVLDLSNYARQHGLLVEE